MNNNIKLMVVMKKMNNAFLDQLGKNLEGLGITPSAYTMLAHLNTVERSKTQKLGEVALITSGTITHSINKLIKSGYVMKVQDEKDKRVFWIQITDAGRAYFMGIHKEHMVFLDDLLKAFSEEEKESFIEMIKHIGKGVENKE